MQDRENEPFLRVLFVEATGRFARRMYAGDRAAFTVEQPGVGWFIGHAGLRRRTLVSGGR